MKPERFSNLFHAVIFVFISLIIFTGCASTGSISKAAEEKDQGIEIKNVKITEFILGPGDTINVSVYRQDDLKRSATIEYSGKITFPLIGDIQVSGMSIFQVRDKIRDELKKYILDPQVSVDVVAIRSQKIIVLGEVMTPGLFSLDSPLNTLEAISKAGGFTLDAKKKNVLLIRGGLKNPQLMTLNIDRIFSENDMAQNVSLQNGDILYVPATFIANVSRYFDHLSKIISPVVQLESGYFVGQQIERGSKSDTTVPIK
jgi:polysaccharide export outer membrane protein